MRSIVDAIHELDRVLHRETGAGLIEIWLDERGYQAVYMEAIGWRRERIERPDCRTRLEVIQIYSGSGTIIIRQKD